jgi:flagellar basal-body rod protein FlgC
MLPDRIFSTFQTAAKGLDVQREKIAVASRNIANANTSAPENSSSVYKPQSVQVRGPELSDFRKVLLESVSSLDGSRSANQSRNAAHELSGRDLGPQFEITETDKFRYEYDPNHPDADENGMVRYPDIDMIREMTQLISANRLYEANLSTIEAEKEIIRRSLDI